MLWFRQMALVIGQTHWAVAFVLGSFMSGNSLGTAYGRRRTDRGSAVERLPIFCSALGFALTPVLAPLIEAAFHPWLGSDPFSITRWMVWSISSLILVFLPAFVLGMTTSTWLHASENELGGGRLYAWSCAGSVIGVALAGYGIIPHVGLRAGFAVCGAATLGAALLWRPVSRPPAAIPPSARPVPRRLAAIVLINGAVAMTAESAWIRLFSSFLGSSHNTLMLVLSVVLAGWALGAALEQRLRRRKTPTAASGALILGLTGLFLFAGWPVLNQLPYWIHRFIPTVLEDPIRRQIGRTLFIAALVFVPSMLMGAAWPSAYRACPSAGIGLLAVQGVGGLAGALIGGGWLLAKAGAPWTLALSATLSIVGLWILGTERRSGRSIGIALAVTLTALGLGFRGRADHDPMVMTCGPYLPSPPGEASTFAEFRDALHRQARLIFLREGATGTIAVLERAGHQLTLRVNGKADASSVGDMPSQLLMAYLPVLYADKDRLNVRLIGLGGGITAGALAELSDVERVDVDEIEPAVIEASALFADVNRRVLSNAKCRIQVADGRQALKTSSTLYDLIVTQPSNPWTAGSGNLFTRESFIEAKRRLAPGGVQALWFQGYAVTSDAIRTLVATFTNVYPHVRLLRIGAMDYLLIGGTDRPPPVLTRWTRRWERNPTLRRDLLALGYADAFDLLSRSFVLDDEDLRLWADGAALNTDDHPRLEFRLAETFYSGSGRLFRDEIWALRQTLWPKGARLPSEPPSRRARRLRVAGNAFAAEGFWTVATRYYRDGLVEDPASPELWFNLGISLRNEGKRSEAKSAFEAGLRRDPANPKAGLLAGIVDSELGDWIQARRRWKRALSQVGGNDVLRRELLAHLASANGR